MTDVEKQLVIDFRDRRIGLAEFEEMFPIDLSKDKIYLISEIDSAIKREDEEGLELVINLLWLTWQNEGNSDFNINILNKLLTAPFHRNHQEIAMTLQRIKSPTTIPFVRTALESNFNYLSYTCSESGAIAKWFSWILSEINTKESWSLIEEFSHSKDEGIRLEMLYRLKKINSNERYKR